MRTLGIFLLALILGCSDGELPPDTFFLSKEWKMVELSINGIENDISGRSNYRLRLREDLTFTRINFDQTEVEGTWELQNGGNQLVLYVNVDIPERYLILDLQFRKLELQVVQASTKTGETVYQYVLEPTRP